MSHKNKIVNTGKTEKRPAAHNDQLGENASEEYSNESYMNAPKAKGNANNKKGQQQ